MSHIWRALVPEPKKTVDQHFGAILQELLKVLSGASHLVSTPEDCGLHVNVYVPMQEMGGRLWRNREASCNALSDLLQGRRWPELKDKLGDIWTMTLRASDDIKESVRGAATILGKTLRNLTLRLCDPQVTPTREAGEAVSLALPLMLEKGQTAPTLTSVRNMAHVAAMIMMCMQQLCVRGSVASTLGMHPCSLRCTHLLCWL